MIDQLCHFINISVCNAQVDLLRFFDVLKWTHKLTVPNAASSNQTYYKFVCSWWSNCWSGARLIIIKQSVQLSKLINGLFSLKI